jgi:hypothetical protein
MVFIFVPHFFVPLGTIPRSFFSIFTLALGDIPGSCVVHIRDHVVVYALTYYKQVVNSILSVMQRHFHKSSLTRGDDENEINGRNR